jgi:hypothetical protein|tara:strand:+ start:1590 stop:2201 length:612 start_codon:yes stop_codon:yes gene_type:complete
MAFEKGRRAAERADAKARTAQREASDAEPVAVTDTIPEKGVSLSFAQFKELVKEARGDAGSIGPTEIADIAARAAAKARRPENNPGPLVSDYNPVGDRDHPRPPLRATMYFGSSPIGTPQDNAQLTKGEIEALNEVTPGYYNITKMDGSKVVIEVRGQVNANRKLERMWFLLPEGDEDKNLYPPLASFAQQCVDTHRVDPITV